MVNEIEGLSSRQYQAAIEFLVDLKIERMVN